MEHTPGLWKIENNGELQELDGVQYVRIMGPGEYEHICDVFETPALPSYPNVKVDARANAEFIVRAHNSHDDLLEALKYVVSWHRENDSGEGELFGLDYVTTCIAAIAKAEGKEV